MAKEPFELINFILENGTPGVAMIQVIPLPDARTLVACANTDEEDDAPVNMAVEYLFTVVCRDHRLDPAKVVWVEYNSEIYRLAGQEWGGWELVAFDGAPGTSHSWRQMTMADWEGLGTTPPKGPQQVRRDRE